MIKNLALLLVDGDTWEVRLHTAQSIWGHRPPAERLLPGEYRIEDTWFL